MKEKLISRVSRIISGSVHSFVDSLENTAPESVLSEAILEIESATDDVRNKLGQIVAKSYLASSKLTEENKKHKDLRGKIEFAIKEKRDDLAETAIARQLDIETQIPILELSVNDCKNQEKELESYINALQAKKREMQEELILFRNIAQKDGNLIKTELSPEIHGSVESKVLKAESVFERVIENTTGSFRQNVIFERKSAAQLAELEEITRKKKIQERLYKIKREAN